MTMVTGGCIVGFGSPACAVLRGVAPEAVAACAKFTTRGDASVALPTDRDPLLKLAISRMSVVLATESEADVEAVYGLVLNEAATCGLLVGEYAAEVAALIASTSADQPAVRFRLLAGLYGQLDEQTQLAAKLVVLTTLISFAAHSGLSGATLEASFDDIAAAATAWTLEAAQRRALNLALSVALEPIDVPKSQRFLYAYLASFAATDDLAEAKAPAARALVGAIRDPVTCFRERRDLLTLPAVVAVSSDKALAPLLALLGIFSRESYAAYVAFVDAHPTLLSQHALDATECARSMRLLSLCSLAVDCETVPYADVAEVLRVSEDDVEAWVVKAITQGLLQAKMHQIKRVVQVQRCCLHRVVTVDNWNNVQSKLNTWKANINKLQTAVKSLP